MSRDFQQNQELQKSYESKIVHDQSIKYLNQPTFIQAGLWLQQKYSNVRGQDFYQIYFAAELLKTLVELALDAYQEAVCIFRYIKTNKDAVKKNQITDKDIEYVCYNSNNENENKKVKQIQHVLYLNLSLGYIKTQQYQNAIAACTLDLEIEPKSVKSLYRRALARYSLNNKQKREQEMKMATADLKKALEIDPNDEDIKDLLCQIQENQNFKVNQQSELNLQQQSDMDVSSTMKTYHNNDNLSVSSSNSSRTTNSIQKSQINQNNTKQSVLKETAPSVQVSQTKQIETDLISAKSTPQTLDKVNIQPPENNQSKESENKENNITSSQQYEDHKDYLLKTNPSYAEYYNRQLQLAEKLKQQKTPAQGSIELSKVSAATILSNIKNNNNNQVQKQQKEESTQQNGQTTIQNNVTEKQDKQLSQKEQKQKAKEKKKQSEQERILKVIEEEKENQRKAQEKQEQLLISLQQQKEEQERKRQEQIQAEIARQALKNKQDTKTTIKKGTRKIKNPVQQSQVIKNQSVIQQNNQIQQQQLANQKLNQQLNDQQKMSQLGNGQQANLKKPNVRQRQNFDEDDYFDQKEEERLKQYKLQREDDDDDYQGQQFQDPLQDVPPYLPPAPTEQGGSLDLCEGNQILRQRERDKIFQHSYKSNYQDYLDQKHLLDSDVDVPEIPGLIPPSYKSYAQKRREALLNENTSQEKKELSKYKKILLIASIIIFILALWWSMGDDTPQVTLPDNQKSTEGMDNDDETFDIIP